MVAVLSSVPIDHLEAAIISLQRKVDLQHMSTGLDDLDDTCNNTQSSSELLSTITHRELSSLSHLLTTSWSSSPRQSGCLPPGLWTCGRSIQPSQRSQDPDM